MLIRIIGLLTLFAGLGIDAAGCGDTKDKPTCSKDAACMWVRRSKKCVAKKTGGKTKTGGGASPLKSFAVPVVMNGFGTISYAVPGSGGEYKIFLVKNATCGEGCTGGNQESEKVQFRIDVSATEVEMTWVSMPAGTPVEWRSRKVNILKSFDMKPHWPETLLGYKDSERWFWISVDAGSNNRIRFGFGYQMVLNTLLDFEADVKHVIEAMDKDDDTNPHLRFHRALQNIHQVKVDGRDDIKKTLPMNKFPVVTDPFPVAIHPDKWNLWMISQNDATNVRELPKEAQQLYSLVAGPEVILSDFDADAINYSLDTPGMRLFNILLNKTTEFGEPDPHKVYIRCTIGKDEGNSPGIPYVLEIWPKLCYSPVHSHSNASAIIKVLHGEITVTNYNQLQDYEEMVPYAENVFKKGDVTFITPELYQTHKLFNARDDTACITIQSYRYPDADHEHYEYFDYIEKDKNNVTSIEHFYPSSDLSFEELMGTVRYEYMHSKAFIEAMYSHRNTEFDSRHSIFGSLTMEYV